MKRGEIFFANLNPTVGAEIKKRRPVLIVSNDANNKSAKTVTIIPITSNVTKCYPFEVFLPMKESKLPKDSKAQCHQIRTISKNRITGKKAGSVKKATMVKVNAAMRLHLAI